MQLLILLFYTDRSVRINYLHSIIYSSLCPPLLILCCKLKGRKVGKGQIIFNHYKVGSNDQTSQHIKEYVQWLKTSESNFKFLLKCFYIKMADKIWCAPFSNCQNYFSLTNWWEFHNTPGHFISWVPLKAATYFPTCRWFKWIWKTNICILNL